MRLLILSVIVFIADWARAQFPSCDETIMVDSTVDISRSNYTTPKLTSGTICTMTMTTVVGKVLKLTVTGLELTEEPSAEVCHKNHISVGDDSNILKTYCTITSPVIVDSRENVVYLRYMAYGILANFSATVTVYDPTLPCGSVPGSFLTSEFFYEFPAKGSTVNVPAECDYIFLTAVGSKITANVTEINLEPSDCTDNYVAIGSHVPLNLRDALVVCGSETPEIPYVTDGNLLVMQVKVTNYSFGPWGPFANILFKTDNSNQTYVINKGTWQTQYNLYTVILMGIWIKLY